MPRFIIKPNDALAAAIAAKAAEELQDPDVWILAALAAHVSGKCSASAPAAASGGDGDGGQEARPRGRPKGGSVISGKWYDDVMTGTAEEARAALVACGFIPAGPYETLEGDPENPAPPTSLMELQAKILVHEIKAHPEKTGELLYVQRTRTLRSKKEGDWDESVRVVSSTRAELWGMAKEAATLAAAAAK